MKKQVLQNDQDCIDLLLRETKDNLDLVEEVLGIQFGTVTGEFVPTFTGAPDYEEIDRILAIEHTSKIWRKLLHHAMPESYPCVAVFKFENSFDRTGLYSVQFLEFVYPVDFT